MRLVAMEGISLSAQHIVRPGEAFELDDAKCVAELLAIGAARADDGASDTTGAQGAPGSADESAAEPVHVAAPEPAPAAAPRKSARK